MRNHEALPGDPLEWDHTYRYAKELIEDGVLEEEKVIYHLSMFDTNQSEEAYEWLVNEASSKHLLNFNNDDPYEDWPFLVFDQDGNKDPSVELNKLLENTYLGPIKKRRIGNFIVRLSGNFAVLVSMYSVAYRFSDEGKFISSNILENVAEATAFTLGVIAVRLSFKDY